MITRKTIELSAQRQTVLAQMVQASWQYQQADAKGLKKSRNQAADCYEAHTLTLSNLDSLIEQQREDATHYQDAINAIIKWKKQAKRQGKRVDHLQKENTKLKRQLGDHTVYGLEDFNVEIATPAEQITLLSHKLMSREKQIIELTGQKDLLSDEVSDQEAIINRLNIDRDELKNAIKHRNDQIKALRNTVKNQGGLIEEMTDKLYPDGEDIAFNTTPEEHVIRQALETERHTNHHLNEENERLSKKVFEKKAQLDKLGARIPPDEVTEDDEKLIEDMIVDVRKLFGFDAEITCIKGRRVSGKLGTAA